MMFSDSPALSTTFLKISKENEFADSMSETWFVLRFIWTGSVGKVLSDSFLHDKKVREITTEIAIAALRK